MQAGLRDVVSLPLTLEQLEGSVRAAAQWSRALRDRVTGEESAAGALGGQLIAVAGAKGGVGTTTVALQLTLAAVRAAPGRPVCLVDFDLQKGDLRGYLNLPYRRSVVDLVEVANEISVRHLQETLYTHKEGFRVLLAPDEGERGEEVGSGTARAVLAAVKARHALTIVDLGAQVSEASAIGAEMAGRVAIVTTPDVVALRGVKRLRDLWRRLQVREDDDVHVVLNRTSRKLEIQPDLARKVVGGALAQTTIPDDFAALEAAVNTGAPARVEDAKLRSAFERLAAELDALPDADESEPAPGEPRGLLSRLGGERGQSSAEVMGLLPIIAVILLGMWQMGLVGYTYMLAGHAAREGARELATDPTKTEKLNPYERTAREDLPKAWAKTAEITLPGKRDDVKVEVRVKLDVPVVIPGIESGFTISSSADTVGRERSASSLAAADAHAGAGGVVLMRASAARRAGPGVGRADGHARLAVPRRAVLLAADARSVDGHADVELRAHRQPRRGARRRREEGGAQRAVGRAARRLRRQALQAGRRDRDRGGAHPDHRARPGPPRASPPSAA